MKTKVQRRLNGSWSDAFRVHIEKRLMIVAN